MSICTMAAKKRILASEIYIGNMTLEGTLLALAEQAKEARVEMREMREEMRASREQADKDREQARLSREQADKDREQARLGREQADKDREQARLEREQIYARMDQHEREIQALAQGMMSMADRTDKRLGKLEKAA
jgi:hypothetical protein